MAVIKLAKQQNQWQIVSQWCDLLNPNSIDKQPMIVGDRKGKSKQEQWFFAKVKSLIELQLWKDARFWALEAIKFYPKEINFHRWSALALSHQGEINKAIDELNNLILQYREEWYILQDLADLYYRL